MNKRFRIICDEEGKRLDVFLSDRLELTRTRVKYLLEEGHVRADGRVPKASLLTRPSMVIEGEIPEEKPLSLEPEAIPLDILYEDEYMLAINKPGDMVVHPSFGHAGGTLVNALLAYLGQSPPGPGRVPHASPAGLSVPRPGIVHRLDKGTTGVILVARDGRTQELLSGLFKDRLVEKTYRAVVEGEVRAAGGAIEGNIGRHPVDRKRMAVLQGKGREAFTRYRVLAVGAGGFSYVECYPRTGRTHQVRVHLAHIGHPVVGDELYGRRAKGLAKRPLLHAYRITFDHPVTGAKVSLRAPVPPDMEEFLREHHLQTA